MILELSVIAAKLTSWSGLEEAIADLVSLSKADRIHLCQNVERDRALYFKTVIETGMEFPLAPDYGIVPYDVVPRWESDLSAGIGLGGRRSFPDHEQSYLNQYFIEALLVLPVFCGDRWWGFISWINFHPREWMPDDIYLMKLAAQVVGNFLQEQELQKEIAIAQKLGKHAQESLQIANSSLRGFSHDFRSPLNATEMWLGVVLNELENLSGDGQQALVRAFKNTQLMQSMCASLASYVRIGSQGLNLEVINLQEVAMECRTMLGTELAELGTVFLCQNLPSKIKADKVLILLVFQNLIGNALKFRKPDIEPSISISGIRRTEEWEILVADNGVGMSDRVVDRCFQVLYKENPESEGYGMGLTICQQIIHRHGGRIWVESTPSIGSIFHFTLPTAYEHE